ncbi:MAG: hypothetical protein ACYCVB_08950 [Bacilli bacterium]
MIIVRAVALQRSVQIGLPQKAHLSGGDDEPLSVAFEVLLILSIIAAIAVISALGLILGLIRPRWALPWGKRRNRWIVVFTYGPAFVISFVLMRVIFLTVYF